MSQRLVHLRQGDVITKEGLDPNNIIVKIGSIYWYHDQWAKILQNGFGIPVQGQWVMIVGSKSCPVHRPHELMTNSNSFCQMVSTGNPNDLPFVLNHIPLRNVQIHNVHIPLYCLYLMTIKWLVLNLSLRILSQLT